MCGATSERCLPALECAVTVTTSTPGCADSRRSASPPAYPDAPTTAPRTRCGVSAVAGMEAGILLAEDMPEVYTAECMNSQRRGGSPQSGHRAVGGGAIAPIASSH